MSHQAFVSSYDKTKISENNKSDSCEWEPVSAVLLNIFERMEQPRRLIAIVKRRTTCFRSVQTFLFGRQMP